MLDLSDDEELQRLREAALKSKRKTGIQDKIEDVNHEVEENRIPQVPANPPIPVHPGPPLYAPFYGPPPPIQQNQPLMIPLALPQPIPPTQLNNLHFPTYQHYLAHTQGNVLNHLTSVRPRIHPMNLKKLDFNRTNSPGYKSSNLIVITGNEPENSSTNIVHLDQKKVFSSNSTKVVKKSPKAELSGLNKLQDQQSNESDHFNPGKEDKVKISKFERYKSNESSDDEETYISPSDTESPKSDVESEMQSEIENEKDSEVISSNGVRIKSSPNFHEVNDSRPTEITKNTTSSDEWTSEENASIENENRLPLSSSKSSKASSQSSDRKRMLSFSDDVEDFHLDIPDVGIMQTSKIDNCKREIEACPDISSIKCQVNNSRKRSPEHVETLSEKEQLTSSKSKEKIDNKSPRRKIHKSSGASQHSGRSRNTKSLVNKIDSGNSMLRKTERLRDSPKRPPLNIKKKYAMRDDYYERSPEPMREKAFRKARYCDDRDLPEYVTEYREYPRGFSHHHRGYEKNDSYAIRDVDDHYFYGEERRGHDDYLERTHDNYYRSYLDPHRSGADDDDHYRYQSPLPKRYRGIERDHYGDAVEREAMNFEMSRRYDEEHYAGRPSSNKRHLTVSTIPSLLEGIYIEKRHATDNPRDKFRPQKIGMPRSELRDHLKPIDIPPRVKEVHENVGKTKKLTENFRPKSNRKGFNKESTVQKPCRRIIEAQDVLGYSNQDNEGAARSRNIDQSDAGLKTTSFAEKKSTTTGSSNKDRNSNTRTFERPSIHNRLGAKPKKSAIYCKKTQKNSHQRLA